MVGIFIQLDEDIWPVRPVGVKEGVTSPEPPPPTPSWPGMNLSILWPCHKFPLLRCHPHALEIRPYQDAVFGHPLKP